MARKNVQEGQEFSSRITDFLRNGALPKHMFDMSTLNTGNEFKADNKKSSNL